MSKWLEDHEGVLFGVTGVGLFVVLVLLQRLFKEDVDGFGYGVLAVTSGFVAGFAVWVGRRKRP